MNPVSSNGQHTHQSPHTRRLNSRVQRNNRTRRSSSYRTNLHRHHRIVRSVPTSSSRANNHTTVDRQSAHDNQANRHTQRTQSSNSLSPNNLTHRRLFKATPRRRQIASLRPHSTRSTSNPISRGNISLILTRHIPPQALSHISRLSVKIRSIRRTGQNRTIMSRSVNILRLTRTTRHSRILDSKTTTSRSSTTQSKPTPQP